MRLLVAAFALLALIALGLLGFQHFRRGEPPVRVEAEIGEARFRYPPKLARDAETRAGGAAQRLAFLLTFPGFSVPQAATPGESGTPRRMLALLTIAPSDEAIDPAERPSRLYARFLEAEAVPGPGGLIRRRFEKGMPYELEELYVAPPDGSDFFARCRRDSDAAPDTADPVSSCSGTARSTSSCAFPPRFSRKWKL
jgi:hypothetical protein